MQTAKLFMNGRSQAVRLPKEFRFDGVDEVAITREGRRIVLEPKRQRPKTWDEVIAAFNAVGGAADFPLREQPEAPEPYDPLKPYSP